MSVWTEQRSGLASQGPAGPPGPSGGSSTPAPQITSSTHSIIYSGGMIGASGTITLPTSDPDYNHLRRIDVTLVDPNGVSFRVASLVSTTTYPTTPFSGSTIAWSGIACPQPSTSSSSWSLTFQVYNEAGAPTLPPLTYGSLTIYAYVVGSVSAVESYTYQDPGGGLHEVIAVTITVASTSFLPITADIWLKGLPPNVDTWYNQGNVTLTVAGGTSQTFILGQFVNGQAGFLWAPTDGVSTTWTVAAALGSGGDIPPSIAATATFSVTGATACLATDVTSIHFLTNPSTGLIYNYSPDSNSHAWDFYGLGCSLPSPAYDASFVNVLVTVQKGQLLTGTCTVSGGNTVTDGAAAFTSADVGLDIHVAGVLTTVLSVTSPTVLVTLSTSLSSGSGVSYDLWVPAPDYEGANTAPIPGTYQGRNLAELGNPPGTQPTDPGTSQIIYGSSPPNWTYPPLLTSSGAVNVNRTFRFVAYAVSRLLLYQNINGSGTYTRQVGWPGGADCGYLTPNDSTNVLNYQTGIPSTIGQTLTSDVNNKPIVNQGSTLGVNASGQLIFFNIQSASSLPTLPSVYYPIGSMIQLTTSSPPSVYQNVANAWVSVSDPAKLLAGALASNVTLAAGQVTTGILNVGGASGMPSVIDVFTSGAALVAQIGTITAGGGGPFYGGWFQSGYFGGSGPASALIITNGATGSITGMTLVLVSGGITTSINNTFFAGFDGGLTVKGSLFSAIVSGDGRLGVSNSTGSAGSLAEVSVSNSTNTPGQLILKDTVGSILFFQAGPTLGSASSGGAVLPSNPVGFLAVEINGGNYKIPFYN